MSTNILDALPRPVAVKLAGELYNASELTLHDLAELQAWIKTKVQNPLEAIRPFLEGLAEAERKSLLLEAYKDAKNYPPRFGSPEANALFLEKEGMAFLTYVILKKHQPITFDKCKDLVERMGTLEFGELQRVASNLSPEGEIASELSPKG